MKSARVQERGQVTVPQAIRRQYGIVDGTLLEFIPDGEDTFRCHVVPRIETLWERFSVEGNGEDLDAIESRVAAAIGRDGWTEADR